MRKRTKIALSIILPIVVLVTIAIVTGVILIEPSIKLKGFTDLDESKFISYGNIVITDSDNNVIPVSYKKYGYAKIDDLNDYTYQAFVAVEDKRFYSHSGVDILRILSATAENLKSRSFKEGASTITQQLVKNTHLTHDKTIKRKINEIRLARAVERKYTKEEILEYYLNVIYFGSGIYGIQNAASVMFEKPASELTLAESAALASIINNPSKYNPYTHLDALNNRKNLVLGLMLKQKYITEDEYTRAINDNLKFENHKSSGQFTQNVINEACKILNCNEKELFGKSLTINTCYNSNFAHMASEVASDYFSDGLFNGSEYRVLLIDNVRHAVAFDYSNKSYSMLNVRRSPASTLKPIMAYGAALDSGKYFISSIINDEKTKFGEYSPKNYNDRYLGKITLEDALIRSQNVPAVKLVDELGFDTCKAFAEKFGLKFDEEDDSLPVVLGGMHSGLTCNELADAYAALANEGLYCKNKYITSIQTNRGVIYRNNQVARRAADRDVAYLITHMLQNCAKNGTASKLKNIPYVAAKTGTNGTKDGNRDAYCIAYSNDYTMLVWTGAEKELLNNSVTGSKLAEICAKLFNNEFTLPTHDFTRPSSVLELDINTKIQREQSEIVLADVFLPPRYRQKSLFSSKRLPSNGQINIIDYFDKYFDAIIP